MTNSISLVFLVRISLKISIKISKNLINWKRTRLTIFEILRFSHVYLVSKSNQRLRRLAQNNFLKSRFSPFCHCILSLPNIFFSFNYSIIADLSVRSCNLYLNIFMIICKTVKNYCWISFGWRKRLWSFVFSLLLAIWLS